VASKRYARWYVDGYKNLRADMIYHDGANHYLYREIKESVSDEQLENILDKIYTGSCTKADISRYTKTYRHTYL